MSLQQTKVQAPQEHPSLRQSQAAEPRRSCWVGASAGTGKTKVLVDRLLRLMLPRPGMERGSATAPHRILCLTFTKTGAAEMANRIMADLARWSVMEDEKLRAALRELTGEAPSAVMEEEARRLFARVLDAPGGLRIMTIHSFCQSVLKRFPVEAGLAPHFELMDEQSALEYLSRCLHGLIADARDAPEGALAGAVSTLALHLDAEAMTGFMLKIMAQRGLLAGVFRHHGGPEGTVAALRRELGLGVSETEETLCAAACAIVPEHEEGLRQALAALLKSDRQTDHEHAGYIQPFLGTPGERPALFEAYCKAFFRQDGEILQRLATKSAEKSFPDILEVLRYEAERLRDAREKMKAARLAELNAALFTVAAEMTARYEAHKARTARLDYEDLIIRTCDLLSDGGTVQWVLYKLDGGIDHILVDEAQDTSPRQWQIVRALCAEFHAGTGAREGVERTVFVVGDEKQSIFSFQGADPRSFAETRESLGARVRAVQEAWEILLEHSFRSVPAVLELVDATFGEAARQGVSARSVRHLPFRAGQGGRAELWPVVKPAAAEKEDAWSPPLAAAHGSDSAAALAQKIAETVASWLKKGEPLEARGRNVRAGDILILVQSRGVVVEGLMRALKESGVPVAGIDRMTLTAEIAVMDLAAAAAFALLPGDDLALATVLKSPLVGLDEEALYALCRGRPASLWARVREERPELAAFLSDWTRSAASATPFEFFAGLLATPCPADAGSGRRAFYARLGRDAEDALDEFLGRCLLYEQSHTPAVQSFVDWFMRGEDDVKREQDRHGEDQVRIMTVHGAKGLQAPVVFLADAAKKAHDHNHARPRLLWPEDETGVPLWAPRAEFEAAPYAARRDAALARQEEEYRRLLYVAMTRAEDRLYVCGWQGKKHPPKDGCWHDLVRRGFPERAEKIADGADPDGGARLLLRLASPQTAPPEKEKAREKTEDLPVPPLPAWAAAKPEEEAAPPAPLAPSRPGLDEPAAKSPLAEDGDRRFRRGVVVHGILEILPQIAEEKREAALSSFLARPALGIPPGDRAAFAAEILAVLRHPDFAPIFGPGSRAEAPVVGLAGKSHVVSGQMDRVLVTEDAVLVVDYKTNRPPPQDAANVAPAYLKQMAAYRAVMRDIYPGKKISCALLWTDGPLLMPLPDKLLDPHMP